MNKVTCTHTIGIDKTPEEVWDYTQNWNYRSHWDFTVRSAKYLSEVSPISVEVTGHLKFKVTYKLSDRPRLTTLVMSDIESFFVEGGGGSWKYENKDGATLWTQNNALILRDDILGRTIRPLFALFLKRATIAIMKRAKLKLEGVLSR